MRLLKPIVLAIAIFGFHHATLANDILAQQLLERSGSKESLKSLKDVLGSQIDTLRNQGLAIEPEFATAWGEAAEQSFQLEKILPGMATTLSELLSDDEMRALITYYETPLAKRIVSLEIEGGRPERQSEALAYAKSLSADIEKYNARMALYRQIDEVANLTNLATNLSIKMGVAVQVGMMASGKMPIQLSYEEIKAAAEEQRSMIMQQVSGIIYGTMTFSYRDLSDHEVRRYIEFLNSTLGKKSMAAYAQALDLSLSQASRQFGQLIAQRLGRIPT